MKNIVTSLVVALTLVSLVGCKKEAKNEAEVAQTAEASVAKASGVQEKATFKIDGMSCSMGCVHLIEGKLSALEGVKSAKVDFDTKTAVVEYDNGLQKPENFKTTVESIADGIYKVTQ